MREIVDMLELLLQDGACSLSYDEPLVKRIMGFYSEGGGFISPKGLAQSIDTAYALRSLRLMYKLQEADLETVKQFLLACQNPDGGFGIVPGDDASDIRTTYYVIKALQAFGAEPDIPRAKEYILSLMEGDGAFVFSKEKRIDSPSYTFYAVFSLSTLGHDLSDPEVDAVRDYLSKLLNNDGGYRRSGRTRLSNVSSTTHALMVTRQILEPEDEFVEMGDYYDSLRSGGGGFKPFPGAVGPDLRSTYHALVGIRLLGGRVPVDTEEWLKTQRGDDGGYIDHNEGMSTLEAIYYGLSCQCLL